VETLRSEGPFTVFAPTDEAFARLPEGTVESLLADPEALRTVLLYHVVPGRVTSAQVVTLDAATSAEGSSCASPYPASPSGSMTPRSSPWTWKHRTA
jgi:uncharacterized surface protein with fasciclin (FAS1) repeats